MKVAVVQMNSTGDKDRNIDKALRLVSQAIVNKAQFILLPEAFNYRGPTARSDLKAIKESVPGESTVPFMLLAKKYKVSILAGSICEGIKGSSKVYNTCALIDPRGKIKARYRKINLFDAVIGRKTLNESKRFAKGTSTVMTDVGGFRLGMSICYDLRFGELYRGYAKKGAHILIVPSAFTKTTGEAHWEVLLRARAIENLCYVLAPNQIGKDSRGVASYGNSMIINPWGEILARASKDREEIIYSHIKMSTIKSKRLVLPGLNRA